MTMETFKQYMKEHGQEYYEKIVDEHKNVTGGISMDNAKSLVTNMFNQVNALKRSFVYLMDGKESKTEDFELNIYRALGHLELQLRGLQKEIRSIDDQYVEV